MQAVHLECSSRKLRSGGFERAEIWKEINRGTLINRSETAASPPGSSLKFMEHVSELFQD